MDVLLNPIQRSRGEITEPLLGGKERCVCWSFVDDSFYSAGGEGGLENDWKCIGGCALQKGKDQIKAI